MLYSYVHGIKADPSPGLVGVCPFCNGEVYARCGDVKVHHWAHKKITECDSWSEGETDWHREWKSKFPKEYCEIPFTDPATGEKHRADIYTPAGITIEFQNSMLSISELQSRETFYKNLIWVVNGLPFKSRLNINCSIPNPQSKTLDNFSICGVSKNSVMIRENLIFIYDPKDRNDKDADRVLKITHPSLSDVSEMWDNSMAIYKFLKWTHKHKVWFAARAHVFFDMGTNILYWLKNKPQYREPNPLWYVQEVSKDDFIRKYSV